MGTDWVIYSILGNFSKHATTIILPKPPTFLGQFFLSCQNQFSSEIIFGQLFQIFGNFLRVTLILKNCFDIIFYMTIPHLHLGLSF